MNNLPVDNSRPLDSAGLLAGRPSTELAASPWRLSPPRPHEPPRTVTLRFTLNALGRWWKVALPIGLLLAGLAGGAVWMSFEPKYEASAWLQIKETTPYIAFQAQQDRGYSGRFAQTQIELMRSPPVLGPVLSRPEVARVPELTRQEDKMRWISKNLAVKQIGQSELYTISIPMSDPDDSRQVVNAVVAKYLELQRTDESERMQRTLQLLEQERSSREEEVRQLQENVRELTRQATGKDIYAPKAEPESIVQHPLGDLQSRLALVVVDREVMQAKVKAFEEMVQKQPVFVPEHAVERAVEQNPKVQELKGRLLFEKEQLVQTERAFQKGGAGASAAQPGSGTVRSEGSASQVSPVLRKEVQRLQDRIAEDEKTLDQVRAAIRKEAEAELKREYAARRSDELASKRAELEELRVKEESLKKRYDELLGSAQQGSGETLALEFKRNKLKLAEQVLDLITMRLTQLKTEQRAPSRVISLSEAERPLAPVELVPYRRMALACLAAFCMPFLLAVAWERMIRRVSESADLEQESQLMVVGEVSRLPSRKRSSRGSVSSRVSADVQLFEESIDSLRTNLLLPEHLKDMKVFAVTSASSHEGKTSVAVSLAVSLARASGQATLLIDGDMRSPDIHELFDTRLEPGLVEVLKGESPLEEAIITNCSASVHLLPAGKLTTSPHTLLGNGAFRALLREASTKYRYCVIDTPPVLAAAESLVMAKVADACLICAMRNISRGDHVRKACERLLASGSRPVGAVLNGVPRSRYEYRHAKYYYPHP